jgi:hypothetical protein
MTLNIFMKKIPVISLLLIALTASNCGNGTKNTISHSGLNPSDTSTAVITFKEYEHNFGKVKEGEKIAYVFTFKNNGQSDLIVASAATTCGCTVPKYDTKPVPPGGDGNLEVVFDTSGRNGMQTKTITVKSNASTPVVLLKITAEVVIDNN